MKIVKLLRTRAIPGFLALLLGCALLGGCGEPGQVRVRYKIFPPRSHATAPAPTPTSPEPSPSPAPTTSPVASARPGPTPTARPRGPEDVIGVPIRARVEMDEPYEIFVRLTAESGKVVAEDRLNEEGFGVENKLFRVPAGRYRTRLWTYPMLEEFPLYDRVIELRHDYPPRFHLGLLSVNMPEEGLHEFRRSLEFEVRQEPSQTPVYRALLEKFSTRTTFGDILWGRLILPFGSYSLVVRDTQLKDQHRLFAEDGLPMKVSDPVPFDLNKATPSVLIDLTHLMGVGDEAPRRRRRFREDGRGSRGGGGWNGGY